jgi:hypothetical protein
MDCKIKPGGWGERKKDRDSPPRKDGEPPSRRTRAFLVFQFSKSAVSGAIALETLTSLWRSRGALALLRPCRLARRRTGSATLVLRSGGDRSSPTSRRCARRRSGGADIAPAQVRRAGAGAPGGRGGHRPASADGGLKEPASFQRGDDGPAQPRHAAAVDGGPAGSTASGRRRGRLEGLTSARRG